MVRLGWMTLPLTQNMYVVNHKSRPQLAINYIQFYLYRKIHFTICYFLDSHIVPKTKSMLAVHSD